MGATPIPQELTTAWQLALERWAEPARHDTLLGLAAKHHCLAWLAGKYRDAAWSNPDDPIARDRSERVRRATALMFAMPTEPVAPPRRSYRAVSLLLLGAVFATGLGLLITEHRVNQAVRVSRHP